MDKAARRTELMRAARDVFATKGYHQAKIDDIVAEANVAKGTFYLYFKDKRAVFSELVDGLFARLAAAILRVDTDGDVEAQVKHNVRAIMAVLLEDPRLTQLLLSHATGLDPQFIDKVRSFYDGTKTLLRLSLEEGQRLGIVAEGDASLFATFSIGALKEVLLEAAIAEQTVQRERIVSEIFSLLERGYLRIGGAPSDPRSLPRLEGNVPQKRAVQASAKRPRGQAKGTD